MSTHAGKDEILRFLSCQDAKKVKRIFLVHGEYEVQLQFSEVLEKEGYRTVIPEKGATFIL